MATHLWVTADLVPRSEALGTPQTAGVMYLIRPTSGRLGCISPAVRGSPLLHNPPKKKLGKFFEQIRAANRRTILASFQHIGWRHSFPLHWISFPIPKHTFFLVVARHMETRTP